MLIGGTSGVAVKEDTRRAVADEYVPVGARTFRVASAAGVRPGQTVIVRRIGNQAWIDAVGMNGETPASRWRPFNVEWDRVVVDVQGNTITVDAPLTCAIETRWGGGEVLLYDEAGRIEHVGVENLRAVSEFDPAKRTREYGNMDRPNYVAEEYYSDEDHYRSFVVFDHARNGWVRNATALHFVNSMVGTQRGSKWITVQDCVSREPVSRRLGGRRFTFALRGQLALVQRCHSDKGRHSFMTGQPSGSGNVFLDCQATSPFSSSEPHEQWATGTLYDNVQAPLTARFWKNIVIGWAGANTVFWNCKGDFLVQKPPRRRISRSATSGSTPWSSISRCRTRRRTTATSSRSTGTCRRGACISPSFATGSATRRCVRSPCPASGPTSEPARTAARIPGSFPTEGAHDP